MKTPKIESSVVIVLKEPNVIPLNPFRLLDLGLFTRDEIANGPMDFGPGYTLKSSSGFAIFREIGRIVILFSLEKSSDSNFIKSISTRIVNALNVQTTAIGINFAVNSGDRVIGCDLSNLLSSFTTKINVSDEVASTLSVTYMSDDVRKTITIANANDKGNDNGGCCKVSINNHIAVDSQSVVDALSRIDVLCETFKTTLKLILK